MIKYLVTFFGIMIFSISGFANKTNATPWPEPKSLGSILNSTGENIVNVDGNGGTNVMREGAYNGVIGKEHYLPDLADTNTKITTQEEATQKTVEMIQRIINWTLGLAALVSLIMVIYGGIQMTTAAGDDGKFKNGKKKVKNMSIGLAGIALSWLIVSFIFWFIDLIKGS